ncbi:MAG: 16S rRNA (uracil(1498)-N(3))-methyltransferase [Bacteroidales bacterium]|nr:16S rRNA (uracil(1498)-N(3))-methyltransferase [Bacteroidales bacterium]
MIQFFAPDFEKDLTLPDIDSGHCVRVLRKKEGDTIFVTDGKGHRFEAIITEAHPKHVKAEIISTTSIPTHWGCRIVLAIAPTKNIDRIEWLLEKATELGIDEIIPLRCCHSERKDIKPDRLEKILISAMKQSLKAVKPTLAPMTPFKEFIHAAPEGDKFICYCADDVERHSFVCELRPSRDIVLLIGPEGDFSPEEARLAIEAGFIPCSLGESRMRTETAALFAVQAVHTLNQLASCTTAR